MKRIPNNESDSAIKESEDEKTTNPDQKDKTPKGKKSSGRRSEDEDLRGGRNLIDHRVTQRKIQRIKY